MEKPKAAYIGAAIILTILILSILYQGSKVISPQVELTSKQEFVSLDEEIIADFKIYNPSSKSRTFRYILLYNGSVRMNNTVLIKSNSNFQFGGQYRATRKGIIEITAQVYEGEELTSETTYFVTVR